MGFLSFYTPVLDALSQGRVIRTAVMRALQVLAVLTVLGGLFALVEILRASFRLPARGTVGGLVLAALFAGAVLAVVQVLLYRARSVDSLGDSPFTVIPVMSVLFRALGEVYATLGVAVAAGGCLFIWLSGMSPLSVIGAFGGPFALGPTDGTFIGGLWFLVAGGLGAFVILLVSYFVAEATVVFVDIAQSLRAGGAPRAQ
jgi:hypothetical protein